jgi:hypothetical protein
VVTWLEVNAPALKTKYPAPLWDVDHHLARLVRYMLLSEGLQPEFASYFKDMSLSELDDMAASFKLENCCMRENLNNVLRAHAEF